MDFTVESLYAAEKQFRPVTDQVQIGSVPEKLKEEIQSWAGIVSKNCKQSSSLSIKSVEQAVRKVTAEEERAKNVIIFGLDEDDCIVTTMESVSANLTMNSPSLKS